MRTLSPEKDESRGVNAAVELISELRSDGGLSGGRGSESRRRREGFDGSRKIQWLR